MCHAGPVHSETGSVRPALAERDGRILVVCTGNVCRSPLVEGLLRLALPPSITVHSAGTNALVGQPMDPRSAELLRRHGGAPADFAARQVDASLIEQADLVVTATRAHRATLATLSARTRGSVFALADLADLAADVRGASESMPPHGDRREESWVAHVTRVVSGRRGMVPPRSAAEIDLIDPYRQEDRVFEAMAAQVRTALPPIIDLLTG